MIRALRIALLLAVLAVFVAGLLWESHDVVSVVSGQTQQLRGPALVETATFDGIFRRDNTLYDAFSIAPGMVKEKDCKT